MFSLCIPTIDRYDTFLRENLEKYLQNPYIDEIIITDENGNDYNKLLANFKDNRIKLYKNDTILGSFLNKLKACKLAKNEWIALIDSDNFADIDYFKIASDYINSNILTKETIIAPSYAKPNFNYTHLEGKIITKENMDSIKKYDKYEAKRNILETFMNTGNYILNKYLVNNINLDKEINNIQFSSACDVIYINTLFFEQFNLEIHIPHDLHYTHVVHNGSIYTNTYRKYSNFNEKVYNRFRRL